MKRLFALLLVLVMIVGLVACGGKKTDPTDPTTGTNPTNGTQAPTVNDKPFKGKKLQLYGFGSETSYSAFGDEEGAMSGVGSYLWMQRAAIIEWATANEVTIEFKGSFNQNVVLAAMNSGDKPDMFSISNQFPALANYGLAAAFTEAEYNELAKHMNTTKWLDTMMYNGKSSGVLLPWTGFFSVHVNIDLCERYGIKSPVDYFTEGNWNWDTMKKFFEEVTKDVDGDGKTDSYAARSDFTLQGLVPMMTTIQTANGLLTDAIFDKSWAYDYAEFVYTYYHQKATIQKGSQSATVMAGNPLIACQLTDCETYNPLSIFKVLTNGDRTVAVPIPEYTGKDAFQVAKPTQSAMYMASSCDEREAVISLMSYLLECGDKYVSQMSHGALTSTYEGMKGSTEHSKKWMEQFAKGLAEREVTLADYDHFDKNHMAKVRAYNDDPKTVWDCPAGSSTWTGVTDFYRVCTYSDPPATALAAGRETFKTQIATYNDLYVPFK